MHSVLIDLRISGSDTLSGRSAILAREQAASRIQDAGSDEYTHYGAGEVVETG